MRLGAQLHPRDGEKTSGKCGRAAMALVGQNGHLVLE